MPDDLSKLGTRPNPGGLGDQGRPATGQRQSPMDDDVQRFRQAMSGQGSSADAAKLPAGPFDLFRPATNPQTLASSSLSQAAADQLRGQLRDMVTRLMVGDGQQAKRSIRMTLDNSVMPGVDLAVYEEEGFWVAHFYCRQEDSFVQLAQPGPDMAVRMADALHQPSLWRVAGEHLPAGGQWQTYTNTAGDDPLAEFRAQPMAGTTR